MNIQLWDVPVTVTENNFIHKSLSAWACNVAVGCGHKCRFCYVPQVSTNRMATLLKEWGVTDPDAEWGDYLFPRPWDEKMFLTSLRKAERTPAEQLKPEGNRAVMFCSTTDPYQVIGKAEMAKTGLGPELPTRRALEAILEHSTLNVRILTRSPLARRDFDLMRRFGNRLLFGMSLPTLDNRLARIYEPGAPAPSQRLETLQAAKAAGIPVYVAVAPVYPDCSAPDMRQTLAAVAALEPVTVFMEPINIRGENVRRIEAHAATLKQKVRSDVFQSEAAWRDYALGQLGLFEMLARQAGIGDDVLHLWPDAALGKAESGKPKPEILAWLQKHWDKVSAWPGKVTPPPVTYWVPPGRK